MDKLRAEYQSLETQKKELTATYKNCEIEVRKFETETGKSESISRTDTNRSGAGTTDKKQKSQLIKQ